MKGVATTPRIWPVLVTGGRAKPADSGHENDPVSECEAVEFLVTTESNDRQIRAFGPLTDLIRWHNQPEKGGSSKHHGADP